MSLRFQTCVVLRTVLQRERFKSRQGTLACACVLCGHGWLFCPTFPLCRVFSSFPGVLASRPRVRRQNPYAPALPQRLALDPGRPCSARRQPRAAGRAPSQGRAAPSEQGTNGGHPPQRPGPARGLAPGSPRCGQISDPLFVEIAPLRAYPRWLFKRSLCALPVARVLAGYRRWSKRPGCASRLLPPAHHFCGSPRLPTGGTAWPPGSLRVSVK